MSEEKKSVFDALSPKQMFVAGVVGGIMVLCTIGFFILLGITLSDGSPSTGKKVVATNTTGTTGDVEGPEEFSQCLDSGQFASTVQADAQIGATIGVNGTPATFINGILVSGALPYEAVKMVVDAALAGQDVTKDAKFDFLKDQTTGQIVKVTVPTLPDAVWLGNEDAKVTIVEFSDFECPYCLRFAPTIKQIVQEYGDKIKFTYRHFPLSFHPNAQKAAEAYECAKDQGMAFEMHDKLFELQGQSQLGIAGYKRVASELGLK